MRCQAASARTGTKSTCSAQRGRAARGSASCRALARDGSTAASGSGPCRRGARHPAQASLPLAAGRPSGTRLRAAIRRLFGATRRATGRSATGRVAAGLRTASAAAFVRAAAVRSGCATVRSASGVRPTGSGRPGCTRCTRGATRRRSAGVFELRHRESSTVQVLWLVRHSAAGRRSSTERPAGPRFPTRQHGGRPCTGPSGRRTSLAHRQDDVHGREPAARNGRRHRDHQTRTHARGRQ